MRNYERNGKMDQTLDLFIKQTKKDMKKGRFSEAVQ